MVSGDTLRRTFNSSDKTNRAINHVCTEPGINTDGLPQRLCNELRAQVFFPSCWDSQNLDSIDHKSHMPFPGEFGDYNSGPCPESHPIAIVSVFNDFFYNTRQVQGDKFRRWVYANGDTTGYGLHGDYLQGWQDQDRLESAMDTCTGDKGTDIPSCSLYVGHNGAGKRSTQKPERAPPEENVGLAGRLTELPGNNPVYEGR
ncbi:hypothetical protein NLG97_g1831 [Lecanicillium saksenae]|uniref:Uncharacterized protein n=1 Tax=Lecanicillium saksenae TaxID=468837 RepID=A0ACC1R5A2_9HYPO|nr:hypothetical protein NLG97_g1831 [Lecanicillium saksenae]